MPRAGFCAQVAIWTRPMQMLHELSHLALSRRETVLMPILGLREMKFWKSSDVGKVTPCRALKTCAPPPFTCWKVGPSGADSVVRVEPSQGCSKRGLEPS